MIHFRVKQTLATRIPLNARANKQVANHSIPGPHFQELQHHTRDDPRSKIWQQTLTLVPVAKHLAIFKQNFLYILYWSKTQMQN